MNAAKRRCADCAFCLPPTISAERTFLTYRCDEFGDTMGHCSTAEARLVCNGDYWFPGNWRMFLQALVTPSVWLNLIVRIVD